MAPESCLGCAAEVDTYVGVFRYYCRNIFPNKHNAGMQYCSIRRTNLKFLRETKQ